MSNLQNIRGKEENFDPFYRYKMPKILIKTQKNTAVFENCVEICAAIQRPIEYLFKYLGYKMGGGTLLKENKIIFSNNKIDCDTINQILFEFIQKFVLCSECGLPETDLSISNKSVKTMCRACGAKTIIKGECESNEKLINFIIKNK